MTNLFKLLEGTPEAVILLLYLIVPGYVATKVYDYLAPGERRTLGETIIELLGWSFLLIMFWIWPFAALYTYSDRLPPWLSLLLGFLLTILAVIVTPILAANLIYRVRHGGSIKVAAKGSITRPYPTSWDWFFSEKENNYYVRFLLKTGEKLGGYYGENSYATSYPNKQEIYVEEVWWLDEAGNFIEQVEGTKGALFCRDDCSLVQFLEVREAPGNQDARKPMAEVSNTKPKIHGMGYQSGKPNSPTRTPPGREHH